MFTYKKDAESDPRHGAKLHVSGRIAYGHVTVDADEANVPDGSGAEHDVD